jgi:preprotein translocase subunit SecA
VSEIAIPARPTTRTMAPRFGLYPERNVRRPGAIEAAIVAMQSLIVVRFARLRAYQLARIVAATQAHEPRLQGLDDTALRAEAATLRRLLRDRPDPSLQRAAHAFAVVREASRRIYGMRHFDVQLIGGYALIRGMIAEMDPGEGKTLTATLAATTMALAGHPVHVVTVNDYLAQRDAELMSELYQFFGLTVGTVVHGLDPEARRAAYRCDITYCTNKELAFDYLKDRIVMGQRRGDMHLKFGALTGSHVNGEQLLLRGLHFAIVDEADSVLVDEARTPLILSRNAKSEAETKLYEVAVATARGLVEGRDYRLDKDERRISLTAAGVARIEAETAVHGGPWRSRVHREDLCVQALTALHLMQRDEEYLVRDGKVQIVDEYTGRVMADRFWSDGLHQMVELKEGCALSGKRVTLARMTYQRFFRRYRRFAGMTGTAKEVAGEMWRTYRLAVARVPNNRPSRRVARPDLVVADANDKWTLITAEARRLSDAGIPVLIGTRSVAASQEMSSHLERAGIAHLVLNAAQDSAEAAIVAEAGQAGRVTVATNLAGRGTDIHLGDGVAERGGLHVIMSERHDAGRIDRQLAGRCARQGDPGMFCAILSLGDPLLTASGLWFTRAVARFLMPHFGMPIGRWALRRAQQHAEKVHARMRRDLLRSDENLDHVLAFSGKTE